MNKEHYYKATITWTGNRGEGTRSYKGYDRSHKIFIEGKQTIEGSSDKAFLGDPGKYTPEDMFLCALSTCHMLTYLHLCYENGIVVIDYTDEASGTMLQTGMGGHFTEVTLHPRVTITSKDQIEKAVELHEAANRNCFIANSCNFPVRHEALCSIKD